MNEQSKAPQEELSNPWKDFAALNKPSRSTLTVAANLFGVASLAVPLSFYHDSIAIACWILLIFGCARLTRRQRNSTLLVIGASLLAAMLPGALFPVNGMFYPALGALTAAACVGIAVGSFFQTATRRFYVLIFAGATAAVVVYLVTDSLAMAAAALSLLPAVLLLSAATNMGEGCTSAICFAAAGLLLSCGVGAAVWLWRTQGSIQTETVNTVVNGWKELFIQNQIASRQEMLVMIEEVKLSQQELTAGMLEYLNNIKEQLLNTMSDQMIRASVQQTFSMLPSIVVVACSIASFLAQRLLNGCYLTSGMDQVVTPESELLTVSLPAAVLYLIGIMGVAFTESFTLVSVAACNLCVILLPILCMEAFRGFKRIFRPNPQRRRRPVLWILLLLLLFSTSGILYLIAGFGACERIYRALRRMLQSKLSGGDNDRFQ